MFLIEKYNDYLLDIILESVKNNETALVISKDLKSYLEQIEHPIAYDILKMSNEIYSTNVKITLLDIVYKSNVYDLISFIQSNKAIERIIREYEFELNSNKELSRSNKEDIAYYIANNTRYFNDIKGRSETTLGRIVNKLIPNKYKDHEIGIFVEYFKSLRKPFNTFDLVNGEDIRYWYNKDRYKTPNNDSSIWKSCMRHQKCYDYLLFYSKNIDKVNLLILKDPKDLTKILGRAIVWKLDEIDGKKVDENKPRYFMDRVYYYQEYIKNVFINYATSNGWIYKEYQNMDVDVNLIDKNNNETYQQVKIYNIIDTGCGFYPFIDTIRYYNIDKKELSNNKTEYSRYIELCEIDGGPYQETDDDYDDFL